MSASATMSRGRIGRFLARTLGGPTPSSAVLAGLLVGVALSGGSAAGVAAQRGMLFVLGPLALLVGLHHRTRGYLHAPVVTTTLALPIPPRLRFAAASRHHLLQLGSHVAALALAVYLSLPAGGARLALPHLGLVLDFVLLGMMAACAEPLGVAASAFFGRRFPTDSPGARLQVALGGGWTLPEAVVHLYAPAAALAGATALAMPLQLGLDMAIDQGGPAHSAMLLGLGGFALVLALRIAAPWVYARGIFEAAPWLHEATRTLAGPPIPDPLPRWIATLRDPGLRLALIRHQRLTPVPRLRYWTLMAVTAALALRGQPLGLGAIGILLAALGLWLWPGLTYLHRAPRPDPRVVALPLRSRDLTALALLALPAVLSLILLALRCGLRL